jgi:hypothetical protein
MLFIARTGVALATALTFISAANTGQAGEAGSVFGGPAVSELELGAISGKQNIAQSGAVDQESVVSHNSVNGTSVTGVIQFDGQAFQNMNGLAVINANTGNNVSFNSSMLVNIVIGTQP